MKWDLVDKKLILDALNADLKGGGKELNMKILLRIASIFGSTGLNRYFSRLANNVFRVSKL